MPFSLSINRLPAVADGEDPVREERHAGDYGVGRHPHPQPRRDEQRQLDQQHVPGYFTKLHNIF